MPLLVRTPEISTDTGAGAAPWASAARGWKGTMKALVQKPMKSSTKATVTLVPWQLGMMVASCARFRVWACW